MEFDEIYSIVGDTPFITKGDAKFLYELICKSKTKKVLELGIAHGKATCIIAAALKASGGEKVVSVDLSEARHNYSPSAEDQVLKCGLEDYVDIVRMQTGYTWFLHDEITRNTSEGICTPVYDICIIDGPKNWTIDGAAFFMCDKLLRSQGRIIFDDYAWTYESKDTLREATDGITHRLLSEDEMKTPHVREIFELLVMQHPNYGNFQVFSDGDWAIAQKSSSVIKNYEIVHRETTKDIGARIFRKIFPRKKS